jgi:hypothetical protein
MGIVRAIERGTGTEGHQPTAPIILPTDIDRKA